MTRTTSTMIVRPDPDNVHDTPNQRRNNISSVQGCGKRFTSGGNGQGILEGAVDLCADGGRGMASTRPPPNQVADWLGGSTPSARSRLGALVGVSTVATLPGNRLQGVGGGRHCIQVVSYFLLVYFFGLLGVIY